MKRTILISILCFFVLILALAIQPFTFENIDAGNVGIRINLYGSEKGVDNITIVTGRVWYNTWTTKIVEFPTFTQSVDYEPFVITTKDAAEFKVDPRLNYHINPDKVPQIYRQYRRPLPEIQQGFMKNTIYDAYRIVANSFTSDSVMSKTLTPLLIQQEWVAKWNGVLPTTNAGGSASLMLGIK